MEKEDPDQPPSANIAEETLRNLEAATPRLPPPTPPTPTVSPPTPQLPTPPAAHPIHPRDWVIVMYKERKESIARDDLRRIEELERATGEGIEKVEIEETRKRLGIEAAARKGRGEQRKLFERLLGVTPPEDDKIKTELKAQTEELGERKRRKEEEETAAAAQPPPATEPAPVDPATHVPQPPPNRHPPPPPPRPTWRRMGDITILVPPTIQPPPPTPAHQAPLPKRPRRDPLRDLDRHPKGHVPNAFVRF